MDPSEIIPPVLPNMDPSETTSNPRYLVKLKKEVTMKTHIGKFSSDHPDGHIVTRTWNPKFLNAYAGLCHVPPSSVDILLTYMPSM